ncbi:hypothetical protein K0M31_012173 [Melipona bicolor]|uniref:Uncharacterized protein n=1 Tax=Melipona bicolor TaxID=60889 RepID=A0AA40FK25_9HYME|nr:hypothetical protein K0M31_012173 [Melipona bicolor]
MTTNCYPVLMDRFTPTNRNDPPPSDYKPDRRGYTRLNPPLTPVAPRSPYPALLIAEEPDCRCSNEHGLDSVDEDETGEPQQQQQQQQQQPPSFFFFFAGVANCYGSLSLSLSLSLRMCTMQSLLLSRCVKSDRIDVRHNAGTDDSHVPRSSTDIDFGFGWKLVT